MIAFVLASLLAPAGAWGYYWHYNPATDHYYAATSISGTWEQTEAAAQEIGGHLVTINDAAEETWLRNTLEKTYTFWIGFTDRTEEGTWGWASGEAVTYTNWAPNEPNNMTPDMAVDSQKRYYNDDGEDYTIMNWFVGEVSYWNDLPDLGPWFAQNTGSGIMGIIEVDALPPGNVPLPSTLLLLGPGLGGLLWRCRRRR